MKDSAEAQILCVDLDGTLIRSDLLFESFVRFLKARPATALFLPLQLLRGRAALKRFIASNSEIDPALLPYNEKFVEYLRSEKARGKKLILATASDQLLAEQIAKHLDLFDEVLGSDGSSINLKGKQKAAALVERYGEQQFDYAGNHSSDSHIWEKASAAIVVSPRKRFIESTKARHTVRESFHIAARPGIIFRTLRVHQWVKNLLIFLPLIMAHHFSELSLFLNALIGYFAFCFSASAVYVLNDLLDLDSDRVHQRKKKRPLPSGELPIPAAFAILPTLLLTSALLALQLPPSFIVVLGIYLLITTAYSFALKRAPVLDILVLASLYTIRILAGGEAVSVLVSHWLLGFSMFFFLSLACVKRFSELLSLKKKSAISASGRGYRVDDIELISSFGAASGYISVMVLALYINSSDVQVLYSRPDLLWLICPLLLFWISRVWLIAHRDEMHDDPIVFAIRDKASYLVGALSGLVLYLAI